MTYLWASPPCHPTASQTQLHLPAQCFKLPLALCWCSFICSSMDTKDCRGLCWGPSKYQADGRTSAVQRKMDCVALLLPLNMYSNSVFLFLCLCGPPAGVLSQSVGDLCRPTASLCICTLLLRSNQAEMKSEYRFCGLTQLSAIQLYPFSRVIKKI